MTTPCPVKLASPCNCTHITLSPNLQSFEEFFKSAYCFARVFPSASGLMASSSEHLFQSGIRWFSTGEKKVWNQPRCEGFGRRDTLIGVEASSYESEGEAAEGKQSIVLNELDAKKKGEKT